MSMIRYSTPTLQFEVDLDMTLVKDLWLTFSSKNVAGFDLLTKTLKDCKVTDNGFEVTLTQQETADLNKANTDDKELYVQCRFLFIDDTTDVSDIIKTTVDMVLKEGLMG